MGTKICFIKPQIRKFFGSFRYRKFLDVPVRKSQTLRFFTIKTEDVTPHLKSSAPFCAFMAKTPKIRPHVGLADFFIKYIFE
jgi:hypothetical protein